MYWKGLWALFGCHDKVVDAFIPTKKSIKGRRYGFMRFKDRRDVQRAISRLNGFVSMGSKI